MAEAPPMKYTVTHYRAPGKTHEEFINWLVTKFLPASLPTLKSHGVLGYALYVTPPQVTGPLREEMANYYPSWEITDHDCTLEYTLPGIQMIGDVATPGMQIMKNVVSDPAWVEATKDQNDWVDMSKATLSLGFCTTYLTEKGDIINLQK